MGDAGGFNALDMWALRRAGWQRNDPMLQIGRLVSNGTRIWVYSGQGNPTDLDAGLGNAQIPAQFLEGLTMTTTRISRRLFAGGCSNACSTFRQRHPQLGLLGWPAAGHEARHPGVLGAAPAA